jgi:hypothetical protein
VAWLEANAGLVERDRELAREGAWRQRADAHAVELDPPAELLAELGGPPDELVARPGWWRDVAEVAAYHREQADSPPEDRPTEVGARPAGPDARARAPAHAPPRPAGRAGRDAAHPADGPVPARDHPGPAEHVGGEEGRARRPGAEPRSAGRPAHQREGAPRRHAQDRVTGQAGQHDRVDGEEVGPQQRAGELAWVTERLGRAQGSWARASQRIQAIDRRARRLRREPLGRWVYREELGELREERARQGYYAWQARARVEQLTDWHADVAGHQAERARWRAQHGLAPEQPTTPTSRADRAEQRRAERTRARAARADEHPDRASPRDRGERDHERGGLAGLLGGPPAPGSALARAWRACQPALARLHQHQQHERTDPHTARQPRTGRFERGHDHARERG